MKSPITGKEMRLVMEPVKLPFRKEEFEVVYHYYQCEGSGEQFTDEVLDTLNQNQVHNQYREKYGIPFPEEIRNIREQYGASASKMAVILGFGANQYRLYEAGEIPSVANGRLILAIKEPEDFIKQVKASEHLLSASDTARLLQKAEKLVEQNDKDIWSYLLTRQITNDNLPSEFSGYYKLNFNKVAQIISYFSQFAEINKTRLNKLLFYTDFGCYKQTGRSMTGLVYRAIQYGPVPAEYDKLYMKLQEDELISIEQKLVKDYIAENFTGLVSFDIDRFSEAERNILEEVRSRFVKLPTSELVNISHQEAGWEENHTERNLISYQKYAFLLKNLNPSI